jgi:hypothetical protein
VNRVEIARQFDYVREGPPNAGWRVEGIQRWCGGQRGDSWCCYFVSMVLDVEFKGRSPIGRKGACQDVLDLARARSWLTTEPEVGCLVISVNEQGHAHHIAICTNLEPLTAIAGNTSPDGLSSNGTGVFEHEITPTGKLFVRIPANA